MSYKSLLTVHDIIHINVQPPEATNIINKHMQFDANHTVEEPRIFSFPTFPASVIICAVLFLPTSSSYMISQYLSVSHSGRRDDIPFRIYFGLLTLTAVTA